MDIQKKEKPIAKALITVLSAEEGGRDFIPDSPDYRPHIVIGDPTIRQAKLNADGQSIEKYLGVCFVGDGKKLESGSSHEVEFVLIYHPEVNYDAVVNGAKFTIREGARVTAFGVILEVKAGVIETG